MRPLLLLPLLAGACAWANNAVYQDPSTEETGTDDLLDGVGGCPPGLAPSTGVVGFRDIRDGGINVPAEYVAGATYNGQPALCVNESGTRAEVLMTIAGDVSAILTFQATEVADIELAGDLNTGNGSFTMEAIGGYFTETWRTSSWDAGTLLVTNIGPTFDVTATSVVGTSPTGVQLFINAFIAVDAP